jgi:hypothetical protein
MIFIAVYHSTFNWETGKNKAGPIVPSYLKSQTNLPDLVVVSGSRY